MQVLANALLCCLALWPGPVVAAGAFVDACAEWGCCERDWRPELEEFSRAVQWLGCGDPATQLEQRWLDAVMSSRADCELEDAMQEVIQLMLDDCDVRGESSRRAPRWESRLVLDGLVGDGSRIGEGSDTGWRSATAVWQFWVGWSVRWQGGSR